MHNEHAQRHTETINQLLNQTDVLLPTGHQFRWSNEYDSIRELRVICRSFISDINYALESPHCAKHFGRLEAQINKEAHRGCGLSFELYSRRFQSSVNALVERLPDNEKETAIALAELHGYARDQPNVVQSSTADWDEDTRYCSHGIELGCCPAGCDE